MRDFANIHTFYQRLVMDLTLSSEGPSSSNTWDSFLTIRNWKEQYYCTSSIMYQCRDWFGKPLVLQRRSVGVPTELVAANWTVQHDMIKAKTKS